MVIAHNLSSINSNRQFGTVTSNLKKSTEKLSSGFRINRAADDAAGLQISEKLRSQIRGLTQASANCQDGVSLCQIADGALEESHKILQRMNELCIKSANGTNTDADRSAIQAEVERLTNELDRIAKSTSYNAEIYPLNVPSTSIPIRETTVNARFEYDTTVNGNPVAAGSVVKLTGLTTPGSDFLMAKGAGRIKRDAGSDIYKVSGSSNVNDLHSSDLYVNDNKELCFINNSGSESKVSYNVSDDRLLPSSSNPIKYLDSDVYIQAGAANKDEQRIPIHFVDATAFGLGLTSPNVDVSTPNGALNAIDRVNDAIKITSEYRSYFGATQNRLEHTIANLDNIVENTSRAESQIRDTDMAKEMVNYSKNNILQQVGVSMMAQANQSKQGILSLIQ